MLNETNAASEHKCSRICYHVFSRAAKILYSPAIHGSYGRSPLVLGRRDQAVEYSAYLERQQAEYEKKKKIARGATNTSYSKEKRTVRQQALRLGVCTLKPTHRNGQRQTRCARVGAWQLCKLCLGLTKRYRHDKVRHAAEFLLRWRNFGT